MQPSIDYLNNGLLRTVKLYRRPEGFGFTLSSQGPCVLSCIFEGSPAYKAGLKQGDQIVEVNGASVEQATHEDVVRLIASSPDGMVRLVVRKTTEFQRQPSNDAKINGDNSDPILHRVDKVVEELKSGQLFAGHSSNSTLSHTLSNGKFVSEEDVVSDEELKASFCESIRSESSVPESSPPHSYSSSRHSSEGDNTSVSSSPRLSRVLYPKMTPLKSQAQADIDLGLELRSIVGYLGSIELPCTSSLPSASLTAIRNCVRRLRAQQRVHVFFLMEISLIGIRLVDNQKKAIVTYPLKSLAFTGLCSDDKRVFGIVTRKANEGSADRFDSPSSRWNPRNNHNGDFPNTVNCSCHVFSVNPDFSPHEAHRHIAEKYGIQCTPADDEDGCIEFPESSCRILETITGMFKERNSELSGAISDGDVFVKSGPQPSLSSSQSNSEMSSRQLCQGNVETNILTKQDVNASLQSHEAPKFLVKCPQNDSNSFNTGELHGRVAGHLHFPERNDSGFSSDCFHQNDAEGVTNFMSSPVRSAGRPVLPVVNVSSFHSRENSADSQFSLESHHGPAAGDMPVAGILRKPQRSLEGRKIRAMDRSRSDSQESLAHSDIVLGSSRKTLNASGSFSSSTHSIHSLGSMTGDVTQTDGRVSRWALGFDKLMEDPAGLGCFKEFLKKEFSDENIVFWIACENFRNLTNFEELKIEGENIFHNHLAPDAPMPVNIDSNAVKDAEEQLQNPNCDMFHLQQQQVYTLMKFDSYPRFLKSDVYRQSLVADLEGAPLPGEEGEEPREFKGRGSFFWKRSRRGRGSKHSSKRSTSGSDGDKRRSFLPWKGKHVKKGDRSFGSQPGSARSSISSLSDSVQHISYSSESLNVAQRRESESFQFCRVVLPDHSSTIVLCKEGQTLRQALINLCERRHLSFVVHDVYLGGGDKLVPLEELDEDMSIMGGREIVLEHRTLFRLELPDGVPVSVKVKPEQSLRLCLEPILSRQGFSSDHVIAHVAGRDVPLDPDVSASSIEHQYVVVETAEHLTANASTQTSFAPGKPSHAVRSSRRGSSKKNALDDLAFEEVSRGRRQSLGNGHFDELGVWVPALKSARSEESLKDWNRGEGSFGKSLVKAQNLFTRKRRESSEQDKSVPVVNKSGRFNNDKPADVKDFFELISKAQSNRMDDQRGELKGNLELPDFLKTSHANGDFKVPYTPPPPPAFRNEGKNFKKPPVKKTLSTPTILDPDKKDLMQELNAKLSKRSDSAKTNLSSPREKVDGNDEQTERLLDYNFNLRSQPHQEQNTKQTYVPGNDTRLARERSSTDSAVYTVDTAHGMRVDTGHRPQPVAEAEPQRNVAHVHPSVRSQATQLVTVNSLRGMHYATNPRRNIADPATCHCPSTNTSVVKPQTINRISSKSYQNLRETVPVICDVKAGSIREAIRMKIVDDSVKNSSSPVDVPSRKMVSSYSLPEVNSQKAEIFVPSVKGPPPVPRRSVSTTENRRSRPKPITDPREVIAGLERMQSSSSERVDSPPPQDATRVGSPLPPPPTPPSGSFDELHIADFSPPPSICVSPEKMPYNPEHNRRSLDFTRFPQSSSNKTSPVRPNSQPNYTVPAPFVNDQKEDGQSTNHKSQSIATRLTNPTHRGNSEDDMNSPSHPVRQTVEYTPGSVTPTVLNGNNTVTPPSTNERTLVLESPSQNDTPSAGYKMSLESAAKRLLPNAGSIPRTRNKDSEKRRSRQGSEIPKLDPYVTYEKEDFRITFV